MRLKTDLYLAALALAHILAGGLLADTKTWVGLTPDWFSDANWNPSGVPTNGETVIVTNAGSNLLLTNSTATLADFIITNKTLTFTNWTTLLTASNVTVQNGGLITLPPAFTNNQMSNRVHIVCTNLTIEAGGRINANGKGYGGGLDSHPQGFGPGGGYGAGTGNGQGGGGGYGGIGGYGALYAGGIAYGNTVTPCEPGSGGGDGAGAGLPGGTGGGAILIEAGGTVTIEGKISADGTVGAGNWTGGGSGGSIYLSCGLFGGSTGGIISADGGNGTTSGGGGGGGRIALNYGALGAPPSLRISCRPGTSGYNFCSASGDYAPELGTVFLPDTNLLSETISLLSGHIVIPGFTNWAPATLTISNCMVAFESGFLLEIGGAMRIVNGSFFAETNTRFTCGGNVENIGGELGLKCDLTCAGDLILNGSTNTIKRDNRALTCGGNLVLTNAARLYVYSGATNGLNPALTNYGAMVSITGDMTVAASSWVYPYAHTTDGGAPLFRMNALSIEMNSGFYAKGAGFAGNSGLGNKGYGPGGGAYCSGGGYGGKGGDYSPPTYSGGSPYGSTNAPLLPGSGGGGFYTGAAGGGLIRIEANGHLQLDGTLLANGYNSDNGGGCVGGGSGGGIFVLCDTLEGGTQAFISASGGGCNQSYASTPGGGGRVAVAVGLSSDDRNRLVAGQDVTNLIVYFQHAQYQGRIAVSNGLSYDLIPLGAETGTYRFLNVPVPGAYDLTIAATPSQYDTPSAHVYGTHLNIAAGTWITNSVTSPTSVSNGQQWIIFAWDATNTLGVASNGTSTQAEFPLNTNLWLTWRWTNQYQLAISSSDPSRGSVNSNAINGWYTNAVAVTSITATASNGHVFFMWTGDVPASNEMDNPLTVAMTQPRSIVAQFCSLAGEDKIWSGNGNWMSTTNWSPAGMPGLYDNAIIRTGTVIFSQSRMTGTLTVSNAASLLFTNWSSILTVSNVTVRSGGLITLPPAFTNNQMSNRVYIVCTNLTVEAGGRIDANGKGYGGGYDGHPQGFGPGGGYGAGTGNGQGGGGGFGGIGGYGALHGGGINYGTAATPGEPGSGGGDGANGSDRGGHGGGSVLIDVSGTLNVDGEISADGGIGSGAYTGGGAGGSVVINCGQLNGGAGGVISADGANGVNSGGGGGGRIAANYGALGTPHSMRISCRPGTSSYTFNTITNDYAPELGTVYLPNTNLLSETLNALSGHIVIPGFTNWTPATLTISNCLVGFDAGFNLAVGGVLRIVNGSLFAETNSLITCGGNMEVRAGELGLKGDLTCGGNLTLDGSTNTLKRGNRTLACGGNLTLTNAARLYVYGGATNGMNPALTNYGALIGIIGNMSLGGSSWVYPYAHATDGGAPLFRMNALSIGTNSGFNADGKGFSGGVTANGLGPGKGIYGPNSGSGAGHGGQGGTSSDNNAGGSSCDSSNAPTLPGSGGGGGAYGTSGAGGKGGGIVRIEANGPLTVDGTISANGNIGGINGQMWGGCGAGGAISIICQYFSGGTSGVLRATGGSGAGYTAYGGGGGGGRIAVWVDVPEKLRTAYLGGTNNGQIVTSTNEARFLGLISVTNGVGYYNGPPNGAEIGSCWFFKHPYSKGSVISLY